MSLDPARPAGARQPDTVELLAQTAFTVMAVLTRLAADHDMSLTQLRVLGILRDRAPRLVELADFLGLEKSTMSGLVTRSERRGLVVRTPDPADARATVVTMTDAGHALSGRVLDELHASLDPMIAGLDREERAALGLLLARLAWS